MRIILAGFGNVGRQLAQILSLEQGHYRRLRDLEVTVVAITTGRHGTLVNPAGIDLARALHAVESEGRFSRQNPDYSAVDTLTAISSLEYDVLVELSPLNIENYGEPAVSHVAGALKRGCHCITANKGPLAFSYAGLMSLAHSHECRLLFESTVMDGIPIFSLEREGLKGCEVLEVEGILNSTTNFILSGMEEGISLTDSIRKAQEEGFAEADPRYDLDGWDSAAKICILATALMGAEMTPLDVEREGIQSVQVGQLQAAVKHGKRFKLICRAWRDREAVQAEVRLRQVDRDCTFGQIDGSASALRISTDLLSPMLLIQEVSSLYDTAYGVLNDLLALRDELR